MPENSGPHNIPRYHRELLGSEDRITCIGRGRFGGKANGLIFIRDVLRDAFAVDEFPQIRVSVPRMIVLATDIFEEFMSLNELYEIACSDAPDERIAHAFQQANLPSELVGDLWSLIARVHRPLAIRSSGMLEDALYKPFAGVYATKMTPNNQFDTTIRFRKLIESIKFVYASTFFNKAKAYFKAVRHSIEEERMAVIVQEVVGQRYNDRFYPHISGVARSYNFYPLGHASPSEGVVELALGLGQTIVDEGISWSYSPEYPRANPPYNSIDDLMQQTQTGFWSVQMGRIPGYDPIRETEYLTKGDLEQAERDGVLRQLASSYDSSSDRIVPGAYPRLPKIINFAPLLQLEEIPLNNLVRKLLKISEEAVGTPVEMEFAVRLDDKTRDAADFGFLQVRPMVVSADEVQISPAEMTGERVLVASEAVMGNGINDSIRDVVYVDPACFHKGCAAGIVPELDQINSALLEAGQSYVLIGFGRWGSRDPWLGTPVDWGQICGARVIVEATLPEINVDLSQGTHFFHNINNFQVSYFSVHHAGKYRIDWDWLSDQSTVWKGQFVRHVRLGQALLVKVDGRSSRGVIYKWS